MSGDLAGKLSHVVSWLFWNIWTPSWMIILVEFWFARYVKDENVSFFRQVNNTLRPPRNAGQVTKRYLQSSIISTPRLTAQNLPLRYKSAQLRIFCCFDWNGTVSPLQESPGVLATTEVFAMPQKHTLNRHFRHSLLLILSTPFVNWVKYGLLTRSSHVGWQAMRKTTTTLFLPYRDPQQSQSCRSGHHCSSHKFSTNFAKKN